MPEHIFPTEVLEHLYRADPAIADTLWEFDERWGQMPDAARWIVASFVHTALEETFLRNLRAPGPGQLSLA